MTTEPTIIPKTIESLADAVYPSFAMLAGMELDLFTPLKDGPLKLRRPRYRSRSQQGAGDRTGR